MLDPHPLLTKAIKAMEHEKTRRSTSSSKKDTVTPREPTQEEKDKQLEVMDSRLLRETGCNYVSYLTHKAFMYKAAAKQGMCAFILNIIQLY